MSRPSKKFCSESGVTLVEFAMVLPLLMVFLMGIIQYSLLFAANITLRNACAMGARSATLDPSPNNEQIGAAVAAAIQPLLDPAKLDLPVAVNRAYMIPGAASAATRIDVSYSFWLFFPFIVPRANSDGTLTITATTIMR